MEARTESAPEAAGVADSSFFCLGFAFAKELKRLPFSRWAGAGFSTGLEDGGGLLRCDGCNASGRSSCLGSGFVCCDSSFARFEGTNGLDEEGADAGGGAGGRVPVLRCED